MKKNLDDSYSPLYFLGALGSGGLTVALFIFLNLNTPHNGVTIYTF